MQKRRGLILDLTTFEIWLPSDYDEWDLIID